MTATRKPARTRNPKAKAGDTSAQPLDLAAYWPEPSALDLAAIEDTAAETGRSLADVAVEALESFAADCLQAAEQIDAVAQAQKHAGNGSTLAYRVLPLKVAARKLFPGEVRTNAGDGIAIDG